MAKYGFSALLLLGLVGISMVYQVAASDPDLKTDLGINSTDPNDFTFRGLVKPGSQDPGAGNATIALAAASSGLPGLTGLALTSLYFTFGVGGQIDPHYHPRASEVFYVTAGAVVCGFVTTDNSYYQNTIYAGDLFVFPKGLPHFQRNEGPAPAAGYSVLNAENPGILLIATSLFASTNGAFPDDVLASAFKTTEDEVKAIKSAFA